MFKVANEEDLNQVSLTGVRSIMLLALLIKKPHSLDEIRAEFIKHNVMKPSHTNDIIRIDLNTLRAMGCEISRADKKNGFKYTLLQHPFTLDINSEETGLLKHTYNKIKDSLNIESIIQYNNLFKKLANCISDETQKQKLLGISSLKHYDINQIKELQDDCKKNKTLKLIYKTPVSDKETEKEVIAKAIVHKNDKVYLYCIDKKIKEAVTLHLKRIKQILSRSDSSDYMNVEPIVVKFQLKKLGIAGLNDCETIVSGNIKDGFIIEGKYYNHFIATQRILSFGSDCTIISPDDFKEQVIDMLKKMRTIYNG